jgi:hypothetical protein
MVQIEYIERSRSSTKIMSGKRRRQEKMAVQETQDGDTEVESVASATAIAGQKIDAAATETGGKDMQIDGASMDKAKAKLDKVCVCVCVCVCATARSARYLNFPSLHYCNLWSTPISAKPSANLLLSRC